jgi:hypothetical protein
MQRVATGECSKAEQAPKWHKATPRAATRSSEEVWRQSRPSLPTTLSTSLLYEELTGQEQVKGRETRGRPRLRGTQSANA